MIAIVGLTIAVVILATDDRAAGARSTEPVSGPAEAADGPRYIHSPGQVVRPAAGRSAPGSSASSP